MARTNRTPGTPRGTADDWIRELADADRESERERRGRAERLKQRKDDFARAATTMIARLRQLFDHAAAGFNATSPSVPVVVTALKGGGFTVDRGSRRLTVLKTADWNVAFSFSKPARIDLVALLSRAEGEGVGWHLYRKTEDTDAFEEAPGVTTDVAEFVSRQLFRRLVHPPRSSRRAN